MTDPDAPVQASRSGHVAREIVAIAYRDYARRYGNGQSLDRLLERGGFDWAELVAHLYSELTATRRAFEDLVAIEPRSAR